MYFQSVFPDAKILVCPAETQGINRENWYQQEHGIRIVCGEVERIGTQFPDMILEQEQMEKDAEKAATKVTAYRKPKDQLRCSTQGKTT